LAQGRGTGAIAEGIDLVVHAFIMIAQQAAQESGVDVAILLFQQQRRPSPAPQTGRMSGRTFAERAGEIELAAIARPPTLPDGVAGQAVRNPVPVLAHDADIADGADLLHLLANPVLAAGLDDKCLAGVGNEKSIVGFVPGPGAGTTALAVSLDQLQQHIQTVA